MKLTSIFKSSSAVAVLFFLLSLLFPTTSYGSSGFVSCSGLDCTACDFITMGNTILIWLIAILFVIFAVMLFAAGYGLVTSGGNPSAKEAAKTKLMNAIIGILIVLAAWLIVDTLMRGVLRGVGGTIEGFGPWNEVQCNHIPGIPEITIDYSENDTGAGNPAGAGTGAIPPADVNVDGQVCYKSGKCFPAYDIPTNQAPYNYPSGVNVPPQFIKYSELDSDLISDYYEFCDLTRCSAGGRTGDFVYLSPRAVAGMDLVTSALGVGKLTINSGFRSPSYNSSIGGATRSQHMQGFAFDISASGVSTAQIQTACKNAGAGFTKTYATFTHCDWR